MESLSRAMSASITRTIFIFQRNIIHLHYAREKLHGKWEYTKLKATQILCVRHPHRHTKPVYCAVRSRLFSSQTSSMQLASQSFFYINYAYCIVIQASAGFSPAISSFHHSCRSLFTSSAKDSVCSAASHRFR